MKPNYITKLVNPREMLSKIGTTTAYYLLPSKTPGSNRKEKHMKRIEPVVNSIPNESISIFDNNNNNIRTKEKILQSKDNKGKLFIIKDNRSRNDYITSNPLYAPKDHIFPNRNAYYSFAINEHKPRIIREDISKTSRYYIDHDTLSSLNKQGTIDFSKMAHRQQAHASHKSKTNSDTINTNTDYSTIKTLTEESINISVSSLRKRVKGKQPIKGHGQWQSPNKKTSIPRTLEYHPNYSSIHPRSTTLVNYFLQEKTDDSNKLPLLREQVIFSSPTNTEGNMGKGMKTYKGCLFTVMKGRIKEGVEPKYPSYMYCSDTKFGLCQTNDISLKMNSYENGIYLKQKDPFIEKNDYMTNHHKQSQDNELRKSFEFMKSNNRKIYYYLTNRRKYFELSID